VRQATHNARSIGPKKAWFQSYHPEPIFETYGVEGVSHRLSKRDAASAVQEAAKAFLEDKLSVTPDALAHKSGHSSNGVYHEYFGQTIVGVTYYHRLHYNQRICTRMEFPSQMLLQM
jgi:hypothetical protein